MQVKMASPAAAPAEQLAEEAAEGGEPEQSGELELKAYKWGVKNWGKELNISVGELGFFA